MGDTACDVRGYKYYYIACGQRRAAAFYIRRGSVRSAYSKHTDPYPVFAVHRPNAAHDKRGVEKHAYPKAPAFVAYISQRDRKRPCSIKVFA